MRILLFTAFTAIIIVSGPAGCADDPASPSQPVDTPQYEYPGFIIQTPAHENITVDGDEVAGSVFVYPAEVQPVMTLRFVDGDGRMVQEPGDSVVVILEIDGESRVTVRPNALPDRVYNWSFRLKGIRLGTADLLVTFLPEGVCRNARIPIVVVG